jgi:hypothetical protein
MYFYCIVYEKRERENYINIFTNHRLKKEFNERVICSFSCIIFIKNDKLEERLRICCCCFFRKGVKIDFIGLSNDIQIDDDDRSRRR